MPASLDFVDVYIIVYLPEGGRIAYGLPAIRSERLNGVLDGQMN